MDLKDYQTGLLKTYEGYLRLCLEHKNPATAFGETTESLLGVRLPYTHLPGAEHVPYVCLRVPTGGGKTRIAGHAIKRFNNAFSPKEYSLVLWLVPSEPIREQTLRALKTPGELLYQDMRDLFGAVHVLDVTEALYLQPSTLETGNTIIVATMQAFKREDKDDLRVYKQNGALMPHFEGASERQRGDRSLGDVIRLRHPFVIVDEAHNQGSPLAVDTLVQFAPSAILELTATPDRSQMPSNVLRSVSAATLQAEDMLKLPVELAIHSEWKITLSEAINRLQSLQKDAEAERKATGEEIKPVMLIQAERKSEHETFTAERVKRILAEDYQIPLDHIAIATGALDELGNRQMTDADYPQFIITVDKLREGWDCPFAYVLFTFRNTTSQTAVEQILGRVLRMPHVLRKQHESLNRAYVYAVSDQLAQTIHGLRDGLVQNGFERLDTKDLIRAADESVTPDLFRDLKSITVSLPEVEGQAVLPNKEAVQALPKSVRESLSVSPETGAMTIKGELTDKQLRQVAETFGDAKLASQIIDRLDNARAQKISPAREITPAERGEKFAVPLLAFKQGDFFDVFDESPLLDADWELDDFDYKLTEKEFNQDVEAMRRARLTISQLEEIECDVYDKLESQLALFGVEVGWTVQELTLWLAGNLFVFYADSGQKSAWLTGAMLHLINERGFSLEELAYRKARLRNALESKIAKGFKLAKQQQFEWLLKEPANFGLDERQYSIVLEQGRYAYDYAYSGYIRLKKHFYPVIGNLKSQGEEFDCAQYIANELPGVQWWVRNVEKKPTAFWLQTSLDRFYPDFLIKMESGLIVAVEYKGAHLEDSTDTEEKELVGKLWQQRSQGKCVFVMVKDRDWATIASEIGIAAQ